MGQVDDAGVGHEHKQADDDRDPQHELNGDSGLLFTKKSADTPHQIHAISDDSLDAPAAASDTDPLTEAAEAALAHLYEEPLETAAAPPPDAAEALEVGALQQAALPVPTLPDLDTGTLPAWQRFAVPIAGPGLRPMIAVVLDDLGLN